MSPASNNSASSDQAAVMLDTKATARSSALEFSVGEYAEDDELDATIGSTRNDRQDMARLGRKQELGRVFKTFSLLGFAAVCQASWEFAIASMGQGLYDGGRAGLIWSYVWVFIGFLPIVVSIAEMASMAPTSGGQYHWVSEFAPRRYQRVLSYFAGWQSILGWQANNASGPLLTGTIIQGLILENKPDYGFPRWHGTMLVISNVFILGALNIWGNALIAKGTNTFFVFHVVLFVAVVAALWAVAPHNSAKVVFTEFTNIGGYSPTGLSLMVGQLSAVWAMSGFDAGAHLSEEVSDSSKSVPIATIGSFMINGALGFIVTVTFVFCIPSIQDCLSDPTGFPFIYVFNQAFPLPATNTLTALLVVLLFMSNVGYNLTTSRELWAFARDGGTPFPSWISHIHPTLHLPVNSILLTCAFSVLMSLIYIGSSQAFFAVASLGSVAIFLTYAISISCILWRRVYHPATLPPARWSLGKWGPAVNVAGILYSLHTFFWAFWPETVPAGPANLNYGVVMFAATNVLAAGVWVAARKTYHGPVVLVQGRSGRDE